MPRPRSAERDRARELWLISGKKRLLKDIAAELGVPENRVRKWKAEDEWEKGALPNKQSTKRSAPLEENVPKKRGAPYGNKNAVGAGAPLRNKNSRKHGLYEKIYWDSLDDDEYDLLAEIGYEEEEEQLIEQIKLLTIRERRLMKSIKEFKEKQSGVALDSVTRRSLEINGNIITGKHQSQIETTTKTISTFEVIMRLEAELTRVQARKTKCIDELKRVRIEKEKLELLKLKLGVGNDDVLEKAKDLLGEIKSAF